MKPLIAATLAIATLSASATSAPSAVTCMDPAELQAALIDWYQEEPKGEPVQHWDSKVQLFASEETGTWTMVRTYEGLSACVIAQGEDWQPEDTGPVLLSQLDLKD